MTRNDHDFRVSEGHSEKHFLLSSCVVNRLGKRLPVLIKKRMVFRLFPVLASFAFVEPYIRLKRNLETCSINSYSLCITQPTRS